MVDCPLTSFRFSNKPNPAAINNNKGVVNGSSNGSSEPLAPMAGKACESCNGKPPHWWWEF